MQANLVLTNGHIHTVNPDRPQASSVAIRDEQIIGVGDGDEMKELLAPNGEWIDLDGRAATPGA